MNKKKLLIILSSLIIIIFVIGLIYLYESKNINVYYDNEFKSNNMLSMMMEQNAGAGDYKMVSQSSWPSEGYLFNSELSRCENGSTLSWDDDKKQVMFFGNVSDKCYVYFDIYVISLKDYVISQYTGIQGSNGLYFHDSSLENGAGDNSYRYAGANPNNFVCFGSDESACPDDNLYRIIGVIDGKVKLIKADYANSNLLGTDGDYDGSDTPNATYYKGKLTSVDAYYWNYKKDTSINSGSGSNIWSTSLLNKTNLNTNYINNIGVSWANKIETTTWKVGGNNYANIMNATPSIVYKNEITTPAKSTTYDAKIGLMYVSDYGFAASPSAWATELISYDSSSVTSVNWMYMGMTEWTISPDSSDSSFMFGLGNDGSLSYGNAGCFYVSRPVMYLIASVAYVGGSGTETDPIRIK